MKNHAIAAIAGLATLSLGACAPLATYPPTMRTVNPEAAVNEPIPTLIVEAIEYAHTLHGEVSDIAVNLPAGTSTRLYEKVIARLGGGHPMTDPDEPAYHVTEVRSQGLKGKVDLFFPRDDGTYAFVTLTFRRDLIRGYVHENTRWWDTGDQPPGPGYAALPEPADDEEASNVLGYGPSD